MKILGLHLKTESEVKNRADFLTPFSRAKNVFISLLKIVKNLRPKKILTPLSTISFHHNRKIPQATLLDVERKRKK